MPVNTSSFSKLTVSPKEAGAPDKKSKKFPTSTKVDKILSNRRNKVKDVPVVEDNVIFEFDSTIYDTEITGSGVTSAYPLILGTLPFKNLYESDKLSNFGHLYEIQNELRDASAIKANDLVQKYLVSFPAVSASLETIKNENLKKYNFLVESIPQLFSLKEALLQSTEITAISEQNLKLIDDATSTTPADSSPLDVSRTRIVSETPSFDTEPFGKSIGSDSSIISKKGSGKSSTDSSSAVGKGGNLSIEFVDDDIPKYENDPDILTTLTARLLGINRPDQQKTTRHYQLLKAALSQILEGRRFDNVEDNKFYGSPYASLKRFQISPIAQVTSERIVAYPGFLFAKKTLEDAASIIDNNYLPTSNYEKSTGRSFLLDLERSGLYYAGQINRSSTGQFSIVESASTKTTGNFVNQELTYIRESSTSNKFLPVIGLKNDFYTSDFINQIVPALASEISQILSPAILPASINPYEVNEVDTSSTSNDDVRFVSPNRNGQNIYLFDNDITNSIAAGAQPITTAILYDIEDLKLLREDIDNVINSLKKFAEDKKQLISNQCSLTLLSVFYKQIQSFITTSILRKETGDVEKDFFSAVRMIMFYLASKDQFAAARLYRLIFDNKNEITHMIARGESYLTPTSLSIETIIENTLGFATLSSTSSTSSGTVPGALITNNSGTKINKREVDILGTAFEGYTSEGFYDAVSFVKGIYDAAGSFQTICLDAIDQIISIYPGIKDNSKLISKIRFGFFTMLLYYVKKISIAGNPLLLSVDFPGEAKKPTVKVALQWQKSSAMFLADCLNEPFKTISVDQMIFTHFDANVGSSPTSFQLSAGGAAFYNPARSAVKTILRITEDIKGLISYQTTILRAQSKTLISLISLVEKLIILYNGDKEKARNLLIRYSSLESIIEMLYQTTRNQTFIPGTLISANITRSENYRSIIKMVFKNILPQTDNAVIGLVGIPYGHLERLRFPKEDNSYYYNCSLYGDVDDIDDTTNFINYDFTFLKTSESIRSFEPGPYNSLFAAIYDDFNSSRIVENYSDDSITLMKISEDRKQLNNITKSQLSLSEIQIDLQERLVQSALQSFVEDIYGLYPRYASTKGVMMSSYPEEQIADSVLTFNNVKNTTDEERLIYSRLKSVIMMHQLFMTSKMVDQIEASPLFDKILYVLIDGNKFKDIISEFYTLVEV